MAKRYETERDLVTDIAGLGRLLLKCLAQRGYMIEFSRAGADIQMEYAFYEVDSSSLPRQVAAQYIGSTELVNRMQATVQRPVVVHNEQGRLIYIIPLSAERESVPETVWARQRERG